MKIKLTIIFVENQDKALKFYIEVLDYVKKREIQPIRWLKVASNEEPEGPELLLEPNVNSAAKSYQKAIEQGIYAAAYAIDDINREYIRLKEWVKIYFS